MHYTINFLWLSKYDNRNHDTPYIYDKKAPSIHGLLGTKNITRSVSTSPHNTMEKELFYPALQWSKNNPLAKIYIWYDSSKHSTDCVSRSISALNSYSKKHSTFNLCFADIQSIDIVKNNPLQFSNTVGLYTRIDFLKIIICHHQMAHKRYQDCIFSDLTLPKTIPRAAQLFCPEAMSALQKQGILLNIKNTFEKNHCPGEPVISAANAENQFLQFTNNTIIRSVLADCINSGIIHITNHLRFMPPQSMQTLYHYFFQFFSAQSKNLTIRRLYIAYKNKSHLILQPSHIYHDNIHTLNIKHPVRYNPKIHGYFAYGDVFDDVKLVNVCVSGTSLNNYVKAADLLSLPNDPSLVRTDVLYRDGKSHTDRITKKNYPNTEIVLLTLQDQLQYEMQRRYRLALTLCDKKNFKVSIQRQFDKLFGLSIFVSRAKQRKKPLECSNTTSNITHIIT